MSERGPKRVTIVEGMGQKHWQTGAVPALPGIWSEEYVRADIVDEMLEALEAIVADAEYLALVGDNHACRMAAKAAIAKAKGEGE